MMNYQKANKAKANFDDVYQAPTPHAYFELMRSLDYRIGEEAAPYFSAALDLLRRQTNLNRLQMFDLGCSYGVGSALVKYGISYNTITDFFSRHSPDDYEHCVRETRRWLEDMDVDTETLRCFGADCSTPAIQFAKEAGLLNAGIDKNFEDHEEPDSKDLKLIRQSNLLMSTGAIGYVTEKTLSVVLSHLGKDYAEETGPYTAVTILRMFYPQAISQTFEKYGFQFARVPGIRLRQRRFADEAEQTKTIQLLHGQGQDTKGWEDEGFLYADLYVGAPRADFEALADAMHATHAELKKNEASMVES